MEVKAGYEKTEVGVIPEKWRVRPFVSIVNQYIDYRGRTPKKLGMAWGGGDILALSANNVQMGYIDPGREAYYGSSELYKRWMATGECQKGDVVLTMEAPLGNVAQIPDDRKYILSQRVILVKTKSEITNDYLYHFLSGHYFQKELLTYSTGSTAKGIQRQKLDGILIYFPDTTKEQTAIATALSDADALISSLEKLIAKKRNIKEGTMQLLLTSKKRLPGFSREWDHYPLSAVCKMETGRRPKGGVTEEGDVPSLGGENIHNDNGLKLDVVRRVPEAFFRAMRTGILRDQDVIINKDGANTGKVALYENTGFAEACVNEHLFILRGGERINNCFLYATLCLEPIRRDISKHIASSAQPGLNRRFLDAVTIPVPQIEEQIAIATILSNMDTEISALEQERDKIRAIKQGMMQELLTGKKRLK